MDILLVAVVTFFASALTLYSGFGLGTILMPVLAFFVQVELAVAMTAVVHLMTNVLKFVMFARHADKNIVVRFGIPAFLSACLGAYALFVLGVGNPIVEYQLGTRLCSITILKLTMSLVIIAFVILEWNPGFSRWHVEQKHLWMGGVLSGFFGGFSGHQGAFRSMFLMKTGLSKESFIATGVVIACLVDVSRLGMYVSRWGHMKFHVNIELFMAVIIAALAGTLGAGKFISKMTIPIIHRIVSVLLCLVALAMGAGIV